LIENEIPVFDPERDLTQLGDGVEIVAVPFTVSPLGLFDMIRTKLGKGIQQYNSVAFDMSTWSEDIVRMAINSPKSVASVLTL
jgi:hypothetical protein